MEAVLRRLFIWETVDELSPAPNERSYQWEEKSLLARSEIHFACEPPQQTIIRGPSLTRDAWDALRTTYDSKTFIETGLVTISSQQLWTNLEGTAVTIKQKAFSKWTSGHRGIHLS